MIIWIDGPFGAGKTTLATRLCEKRSDLLVLDPEEIGYVVKTVVAMPPSGNYQDLPFWRRLTVQAIAELRDHYPQDIAVPMTLLNPAHRDEIFSAVRSIDSSFIHFYLNVDREILCERIVGQSMHPDESRNEQIRTWRLAQVESCLSAKASLTHETRILDSGRHDPDTLADIVLRVMKRLQFASPKLREDRRCSAL